ncbi:hypothetical protein LXM94_01880 [Rhizobium sp. TRM95111]|uniref:hypothetical protein n=1 Tax=Rhizobium alarense TaxID=2846851 RepID=UPI001F29D1DD|nr:hypothetical protein [Rhizobium alarense]MCF3638720.1 hypothetical protein [Rhizobium alarense]
MTKTVTMIDVLADAENLVRLLDTVLEVIDRRAFVGDGVRDENLMRAASLTWIARDMAAKIVNDFDVEAEPVIKTMSDGEILKLGQEVVALCERFDRCRKDLEGRQ